MRKFGRQVVISAVPASQQDNGSSDYAIHGLRKNAAVALADAGCETFEVAAITGHRTLGMVAHYSKKRDQKRHARSAMDKWEAQSGKLKNGTG